VNALDTIPPEIGLGSGSVMLGSRPTCDVVQAHPSVAPEHARVFMHAQGYILQDLGSTTGSYVNGRRIREHLLKNGWRVQLGEVTLVFCTAQEPGEGSAGS
jgi:pSer/pThr/pTyr-binding forkhead associated (FHA) protein